MQSLAVWNAHDLGPVVALFAAATCFCLFHYVTSAENYLRWFARQEGEAPTPTALLRAWRFQRLGGVVFLGLVPVLVGVLVLGRDLGFLGVRWPALGLTAAFVGGTLAVVLPGIYLAARQPAHYQRYPEVRLEAWTRGALWTNAWTWSIYLVAYEFFFRGFLLSVLVASFGVWPGIAAMTALYVYAHLTKGAGETFGCIFMGVVFSWMTLETGAIWAAVLTHIGIALSSDTFALRAHPRMRLVR